MRYIFPLAICFLLFSFTPSGKNDQQLSNVITNAKPMISMIKSFGNFTLSYVNNSVDTYGLKFHNVSTGQDWYWTVGPNSSGPLGSISEGYYDVTFSPYDLFLWHAYLVSCGSSAGHRGIYSLTYTFYNVLYDADICNYLQMSDM